MSIEFYNPDNNNFESDGNVTLRPNKALFKIKLNGICEIELSHPCDKEGRWKFIKNDGIIKAPTPYSNGQLFHVYSIKKNMVGGLNIKARHIFFDLNKSIILDNRAENKTCQEALDIILNGTKFSGKSNIRKLATAYFVKMNRVAAINGNTDNTLISRWGGEIFLDNYNVTVNDHIGGDYGAYINYGNNMLELGLEDNEDNVITRGYPVAFNGRMLPEKYIDSPLINKYREIKEDFVEMSDLKLKEDSSDVEGFDTVEELYKSMRIRMKELYDGGLDKPTVTGTTKVAPLENTTKYKYVKGLVNIGLGDTISIYHEKLDIDFASRCVGYTWNILTRKYESVDVGAFKENFFNKQSDVRSKVESILNGDGTVKADMLNGAINALNTKFKAQRDVAQPQQVRAMLFEDRVEGSPTFGCMCIGTMGFEIADSFKPGTEEWDFRAFGTGAGFVADCIVAGTLRAIVLESMDGSCRIDLGDGIVNITKGIIKGLGMEINLDRGYISTSATIANETFEVRLSNGAIRSNHSLSLDSKDRMSIESTGNWLYLLCQQGEDSTKWSNILMTKDSVNITADGGGSGKVNINGSNGVEINGREITSILTNLEIQAMQSEGII